MGTVGFILVAVLLVLALWAAAVYNRLRLLRNRVENAWSQIDVQLKRRYDLIPNLVEVARGYMQHEASTLEAVAKARNQAVQASDALRGGHAVMQSWGPSLQPSNCWVAVWADS